MMLHRMKYLLKIPLLAISVACNRSAQEIKMIVLQSPQRSLFSRHSTTPLHPSTPHPHPTHTAKLTKHLPPLLLSMTTVPVWGWRPRWSGLNYRQLLLGEEKQENCWSAGEEISHGLPGKVPPPLSLLQFAGTLCRARVNGEKALLLDVCLASPIISNA